MVLPVGIFSNAYRLAVPQKQRFWRVNIAGRCDGSSLGLLADASGDRRSRGRHRVALDVRPLVAVPAGLGAFVGCCEPGSRAMPRRSRCRCSRRQLSCAPAARSPCRASAQQDQIVVPRSTSQKREKRPATSWAVDRRGGRHRRPSLRRCTCRVSGSPETQESRPPRRSRGHRPSGRPKSPTEVLACCR
jgi:hypothetical protein